MYLSGGDILGGPNTASRFLMNVVTWDAFDLGIVWTRKSLRPKSEAAEYTVSRTS